MAAFDTRKQRLLCFGSPQIEFVGLTLTQSPDAGVPQTIRGSGRPRSYRHLEEESGPCGVLIESHLVNIETRQSPMLASERAEIRPGEPAREIVRDLRYGLRFHVQDGAPRLRRQRIRGQTSETVLDNRLVPVI